jgi:hypothetical protein
MEFFFLSNILMLLDVSFAVKEQGAEGHYLYENKVQTL